MTLLGTLLTDEYVYFSADAAQRIYDQGSMAFLYEPMVKIRQFGSHPVLWAYYGNGGRGDQFAEKVLRVADQIERWRDVGAHLAPELMRLNKLGLDSPDTTGALFAGWLDGICSWVHLTDADGLESFYGSGVNPYFVGVGRVAADVAFATAKKVNDDLADTNAFQITGEVTVDAVPHLAQSNRGMNPPLHVCRINRTSVAEPLSGAVRVYPDDNEEIRRVACDD
jgi:hypothetical protein